LPGKPDLVLPRHGAVVFVHGCFWHQHANCPRAARPSSNQGYWNRKLTRNVTRDCSNIAALRESGMRVAVVWECALTRNRVQGTINELIEWLRSKDPLLDLGDS
jgi:DNA mismatch endonuclease (patch repair protein)